MGAEGLPPVVALMGPTAAGKTGLAIELRRHFPLEIISVDSALVYRGMDIGTAKPDPVELARAPHRLVDIRDPSEPYSAAEFREDALRHMAEITEAGKIPLLAGGTMLYFRALLGGLAKLPNANPEIRAKLTAEAAKTGWPVLHARLAKHDPEAAHRIKPTDPQRIQRALEVMQLTGTTLTAAQRSGSGQSLPYRVHKIVVSPRDRKVLHQRIEQRLDQMFAEGLVEEVRGLYRRPDLSADLPAMKAVGYRQVWGYLEGQYDEQEMRARALAATRQLAKRQLTWLRRENDCLWYDRGEDEAVEEVIAALRGFLEV